jgi:methylated-DNA-[protein]-cysteine S-methyltransferase
MTDLASTTFESPVGSLGLTAGAAGIVSVRFDGATGIGTPPARGPLADAVEQLAAYFAGERRAFELDLDLRGTPLQLAVWAQLRRIPFGETVAYGDLAGRVEGALYPAELEPYKRVRLAAATIGRTPTPILVPCHRVIGADGSLTGYGGGIWRKRALLELEGWRPTAAPDEAAAADSQLAML